MESNKIIKDATLIIINNENPISQKIDEKGYYNIKNSSNKNKRINILEMEEIITSHILYPLKSFYVELNTNQIININEENLDNKYKDTDIEKINILKYVKRKNDNSKIIPTRIGI